MTRNPIHMSQMASGIRGVDEFKLKGGIIF